MPKFVKTDRIAVSDDAGNTVWIRRRMNMGNILRLRSTVQTSGNHLLDLYIENILAWEGPDFKDERGKPIPCTPEYMAMMDSDDPFWTKVGDKIAELNPIQREDDVNPLATTTPTVESLPASQTPSAVTPTVSTSA